MAYLDYGDKTEYAEERPNDIIGSRLPVTHQEKVIAELHLTIEDLVTRLNPVLTPVGDSTTKAEGLVGADGMPVSPLATQIQQNTNAIHRAAQNLRGIMERLEC